MASGPGARIEARGWGWRHAGRRDHAIRGLDLVIEPGERVLLLGASGSGKSTLLHGLAGVLGGEEEGAGEGRLLLDGVPAEQGRGAAGLVLQDPDTQAVLARLGDDVAFGLENTGVDPGEMPARVLGALDAVGLRLPLDRSTSALSGGQKQRLALAGVLAMRPRLLLLDEPTANLDPDGAIEVRDAVAAVAEGRTLVVVEHRVAVWWPLMTRVVVLGADGAVLADGVPDAVLAAQRAVLDAAGIWLPDAPVTPLHRSLAADPTAPAVALLRAEQLVVGRRRVPAAGPLDVQVDAASALAITGPNGSGKSTFAMTLAGLLSPISGTVTATPALAAGASADPLRWRSRQLLTRVGYVFQSPDHQLLSSTVRGELALGPRALGLPAAEVDAIVERLLDRLRLTRLAAAHPFTLSGGEKRRLSVATVLATAPSLVVLDEPTFGQDARTWRELVTLLGEQLVAGGSVVMVTHDRELLTAFGAGLRELRLAAPVVTT